ncbi:RNA polymerase sigma factor [Marinilongibacter aquaticus]|uniref:RNA polymerase sigma factor n=1 Tax=Marinilongibacter aquaticus TaxID=2975157 RepID=UPI0021BDAA42|nr:RNA polymerase sigma factor [Marinilongibacter aquaticus]UBM59370.1 RNA polymerase sigma factor [Marinilongibacter aquaticus]
MSADEKILELLADENRRQEAFGLILSTYKERLYYLVRKILIDHDDTDDVLQEVFIKVWKNLGSYRGDSQLYTWLYRIATNESLSFIRRRKKAQNISMDENPELMNLFESNSKAGHISGDDIAIALQRAVLQLPEKQRIVFNLKYFEYLSYEEISEITSTTVGGLKANYHAAKKRIEEILGGD